MPYITKFLDFTIRYKSKDRNFWSFLSGRMSVVDIDVRLINIPSDILGKDYKNDPIFREELKEWINTIWKEKEEFLK
jgi:hypothetical protein